MSDQQVYINDADMVKPPRSYFDLSHTTYGTYELGKVYPVLCEEVVPGDKWNINNNIVMRMQPMVAPILDQLTIKCEYFFVPYRILWNKWEDFITGGKDGTFTAALPQFPKDVKFEYSSQIPMRARSMLAYTLWDYFGFPVLETDTAGQSTSDISLAVDFYDALNAADKLPLAFPWLSYTKIWNDWYRDEDLEDEIDIEGMNVMFEPFSRSWSKDYFTSARPWQQKGVAPALPVTSQMMFPTDVAVASPSQLIGVYSHNGLPTGLAYTGGGQTAENTAEFWRNVPIVSTSFDVADLRLAFAVQKYLELNARAGSSRYVEYLRAQYGVFPRDDRLQRPEYIGSSRQPFITSEVLQLSSTDATSPQGNMAGHGISVDRNHVANYYVLEHGLIMGLMTIMPKPNYSQGIQRQWLRRTRYDFYHPLFANLSEQGIENVELYAFSSNLNGVFGFQGRWDEYRTKRNNLVAQMRSVNETKKLLKYDGIGSGTGVVPIYTSGVASLSYWHFGRYFPSEPALNSDFLKCIPRKDVFAVQTEPPLIGLIHHKIDAFRPLPAVNVPGLIDHM